MIATALVVNCQDLIQGFAVSATPTLALPAGGREHKATLR